MKIGRLELFIERWDRSYSMFDPKGWMFGFERAPSGDCMVWCGPWHLACRLR